MMFLLGFGRLADCVRLMTGDLRIAAGDEIGDKRQSLFRITEE